MTSGYLTKHRDVVRHAPRTEKSKVCVVEVDEAAHVTLWHSVKTFIETCQQRAGASHVNRQNSVAR